MKNSKQSYSLKLPQELELLQRIGWLEELVMEGSQRVLEETWTEPWLDELEGSALKAYKVVGEERVILEDSEGRALYLPSRVRRCMAEVAGRVIRSQAKRRDCYRDMLAAVQVTGVAGNLDALIRNVARTITLLTGKYYRWIMIRQHLRMLRRYHFKLGLGLEWLALVPYMALVRPRLRSFILPFAPDDGQVIKLARAGDDRPVLDVELKLPLVPRPASRQDWGWYRFTLAVPVKIMKRLGMESRSSSTTAPPPRYHRPTLRYRTLKSGTALPFLDIAWSIPIRDNNKQDGGMIKHRAMNVDLGLVNLVTSVVCEAGSQISRPWFWSPPGEVIQLLDSLYHQVAFIQHKLNTSPVVLAKQAAREAELARLYRRINHLRDQVLHDATNYLVQLAVAWSCNVIVIEDLRHYQPVAGKGQLSRELSNWLRGEFHDLLVYKGARHGIVVKQVNPRGTSSYCPRCAVRGLKITDPATKKVDEKGRFFHCPSCGFTADRDYTGALNIYRVYRDCRSRGQRSRGIATCHPVSYTVTASRPTVLAAPRPHPVRAGGQGNK